MTSASIPKRSEVLQEHTWDLSALYESDEAWNAGLAEYEKRAEKIPAFEGTLGRSADHLADYLDFISSFGVLEERLAYYADLRQTEDEGDNTARSMYGKFMMAMAKANAAGAWASPEIQTIPSESMEAFLTSPRMENYRIYLKKILRYKPHILSDKEERILALHAEGEDIAHDTFSVLTNVDLHFGNVETADGTKPLSQSTWSVFMESPDRNLRKEAYDKFYAQFASHTTTLASLYGGSVKKDVIKARIRNFPSARAAALFPDDVPESVYDNLVDTINKNLEPLHRYYALRKKALNVDELRHYDVYVPIVPKAGKKRSILYPKRFPLWAVNM